MTAGPDVWLDGELAAVRGELARIDSKCGVLTAIATGAAALAAAEVSGHPPALARGVFAAAGAVLAAAVLVLLAALRPRYGTGGWCRHRSMPPDEIRDLAGSGSALIEVRAEDLHVLSALTAAKYPLIGRAVQLLSAGVVLLGAGVIARAVLT